MELSFLFSEKMIRQCFIETEYSIGFRMRFYLRDAINERKPQQRNEKKYIYIISIISKSQADTSLKYMLLKNS